MPRFYCGNLSFAEAYNVAREEYGRVVTTGSEEANGIGQITALPPLLAVAVGCGGSNALCVILPLAFWQMNHY